LEAKALRKIKTEGHMNQAREICGGGEDGRWQRQTDRDIYINGREKKQDGSLQRSLPTMAARGCGGRSEPTRIADRKNVCHKSYGRSFRAR
jgi:hypothetical protein